MVTRSTEEAMVVLNTYRQFLVTYGRYVATLICKEKGKVHSRDVRNALASLKLLEDPGLKDFWLGAVFNNSVFRWTGETYIYSNSDRNIHERTVKVWHLPAGEIGYLYKPDNPKPPSLLDRLRRARQIFSENSLGPDSSRTEKGKGEFNGI
jgi:hypothetical protein